MVDSRDVNRYLAAEIWPKLRDLGFDSLQGRVAHRTHTDRIDILEFTTFSSYDAQLLKLKPGSFAISVGCHLKYVLNAVAFPPSGITPAAKPSISVCLLRGALRRRYTPPAGLSRGYWPVGVKGVPFEKVMAGARTAVLGEGMRWFDRFETPGGVYRVVADRKQSSRLLDFMGAPDSPIRNYLLGYAALAAKKRPTGRKHLRKALDSGCFDEHARRIRKDAGLP